MCAIFGIYGEYNKTAKPVIFNSKTRIPMTLVFF